LFGQPGTVRHHSMKPRAFLFVSALLAFPAYLAALTFSEWRMANFTSAQLADPTISGATADPDGEGMANLQEYAFFGQPLTVDTTLAPTLEIVSGSLALTYRERHATTDVSIRLQGSDTLTNWITYNSVTEADRETFTGYDEVTLIDPQAFASNKRFLRLRVELLPINEPRAPTQLSLKIITPATWSVGWTDPNTAEIAYAVEHRLPTNVWQRLTTLGADIGGWEHSAANYQTSKTYRVVAIGAGGLEAASAPISLPDTDTDGIPDALELGGSYAGVSGTYASKPDEFSSNNSGVSDGWLAANGFNPAQPFPGSSDSDDDGISDYEEARRGTDPHDPDTDDDGVIDSEDGWPLISWLHPAPLPAVQYAVVPLSNISGWPEATWASEIDDSNHVIANIYNTNNYTYVLTRFDIKTGILSNWASEGIYDEFFFETPTRILSSDGYLMAQIANTNYIDNAARIAPSGSYTVPIGDERSYPLAIGPGGRMAIYSWKEDILLPNGNTDIQYSIVYIDESDTQTTLSKYEESSHSFTESISGGHFYPRFINSDGVMAGGWTSKADPYGPTPSSVAIYDNGILTKIEPSDYPFLYQSNAFALTNKNDALNIPAIALIGNKIAHEDSNHHWTHEVLQAWNPKTNSLEIAIANSDGLPQANDRLEIASGGKIIRNGVIQQLSDIVDSTWNSIYAYDINNSGVILADATRTIDAQGQPIDDPQSESVLLIPMEFVAKDMETGKETPVSDIAYDAHLAPSVTFTVNSATLATNGDLKLEVSGIVTDTLSELAANDSQRIQQIRFLANGAEIATQTLTASSTHTPWKEHTFSVGYSTTLTIPNPGGRNWVIRAETTANAAGRTGWSQSAVAVSRTPVAGQTGSGEAMQIQFAALPSNSTTDSLTLSHSETLGTLTETSNGLFNGQLTVSGVARAYSVKIIGNPSFSDTTVDAFQAYVTWADNSGQPRKMVAKYQETGASTLAFTTNGYLPAELNYQSTVESVSHLGASRSGSGELLMWRMEVPDGLVESGALQVKVNDQTQELRPFTYSPKKYYIVTPQSPNRPRIFVVTADNLPAGVDTIKPDNLQITGNGDKLSIKVTINGQTIHDASAVVFKDDLGFDPATSEGPSGPITLPVLLTYFQLLYSKPVNGVSGMNLLNYYQNGGNFLTVGDVLIGDSSVDYFSRLDGKLGIKIEEDLDPVTAANLLLNALYEAMPYQPFNDYLPIDDFALFQASYGSLVQTAQQTGVFATNAYLAGLSIANEPFDWAITLSDLSEGKWSSAVGLIPFVPATAGCIIRKGDTVLASFAPAARNVISEALQKVDRIERLNFLRSKFEAGELTLKQMEVLVKGKVIEPYSSGYCRELLAKALGPAPKSLKAPNPHHDLPVAHMAEFLKRGININEAKYGRWVESNLGGGLHQSWSYDFNLAWKNFFDNYPNANRAQIEQFMQTLRSNPSYQ
jgi:hypothetical protein